MHFAEFLPVLSKKFRRQFLVKSSRKTPISSSEILKSLPRFRELQAQLHSARCSGIRWQKFSWKTILEKCFFMKRMTLWVKLHVWFIDQLKADATRLGRTEHAFDSNAFEGPVSLFKMLVLSKACLVRFHTAWFFSATGAYSGQQPSAVIRLHAIGEHTSRRTSRSVHSDKSSEEAGPEKD